MDIKVFVVDYKRLLEKIIDSNNTIRFAFVFDIYGRVNERVHRRGVKPLLDESDTAKLILEATNSWQFRKDFEGKLGRGQFAMTAYDKIVRVIVPLDSEHFILVTRERDEITPQVVCQIQEVLKANNSD